MPMRYLLRGARWLGPALFLVLAAFGARSGAALAVEEASHLFAGRAGILAVGGPLDDLEVRRIELPVITPDPVFTEGDLIVLTLRTQARPGFRQWVAHQLVVPRLKFGRSRVRIEGLGDGGVRTVLAERVLYVDPPLVVEPDRSRLREGESVVLNARFEGLDGFFEPGWTLDGKTLRVPLHVGCYYCLFEAPVVPQNVFSEALGPLPAGELTLEVTGYLGRVLHRQNLTVLPAAAVRLQDGRFEAEILLDPPHAAPASPAALPSRDSALFYFFTPDNWEAMVKVLDGCELNGHFWVFAAAATDVGYTLRVRDVLTDELQEYRHPAGTPAPAITDIGAFACAAGGLP